MFFLFYCSSTVNQIWSLDSFVGVAEIVFWQPRFFLISLWWHQWQQLRNIQLQFQWFNSVFWFVLQATEMAYQNKRQLSHISLTHTHTLELNECLLPFKATHKHVRKNSNLCVTVKVGRCFNIKLFVVFIFYTNVSMLWLWVCKGCLKWNVSVKSAVMFFALCICLNTRPLSMSRLLENYFGTMEGVKCWTFFAVIMAQGCFIILGIWKKSLECKMPIRRMSKLSDWHKMFSELQRRTVFWEEKAEWGQKIQRKFICTLYLQLSEVINKRQGLVCMLQSNLIYLITELTWIQ